MQMSAVINSGPWSVTMHISCIFDRVFDQGLYVAYYIRFDKLSISLGWVLYPSPEPPDFTTKRQYTCSHVWVNIYCILVPNSFGMPNSLGMGILHRIPGRDISLKVRYARFQCRNRMISNLCKCTSE